MRQGDPLSPYLFILAIDPLQRLLHLATEGGQLTNIGSRHARLRTSLYADDAAVFLNPVQSEVDVLITMLRDFGKATGLHVNLGKSLVAPIRCQEVDLDDVLRSFSGARASFPLTYLGLPLTPGRLRKVHFQPLQDKIKGRLSGWKPSLLYMGGCRIMVNSVLSAIPTYTLTVLKQPKQSLQEIDKARRRFLWAGNENMHGGKCKVNWLKVCSPVRYGGLGVPNLEKFARALRLRWLWFEWRMPEKPWIGTETPCDELDKDLFAASTRVQIGDGQKASFWESNWISGQSLKSQAPNLYRHSKRKTRTIQDALQQERWINDIRHSLTIPLLDEFFHVWEILARNTPQLTEGVQDSIVWQWTTNGEYSAKSAYQF